MMKEELNSENAPKPIGPYSQSVGVGNLFFISGQIALDKENNFKDGDIKTQTNQVIDNIESILKEARMGLSSVVKTDIYLKDLADFNEVNDIYSKRFIGDPKPARATVEVSNLPKNALIEISCVAYRSADE